METVLSEITIPVHRIRFNWKGPGQMLLKLVKTEDSVWRQRRGLTIHALDALVEDNLRLIEVYQVGPQFDDAIRNRMFHPTGDPKYWRYEFDDASAMTLQVWIDSLTLGI